MKPERIQRKRTKGWRMPANTIYVGRPTKWGNQFSRREWRYQPAAAVEHFKAWVNGTDWTEHRQPHRDRLLRDLQELRGKNLACWCKVWDEDGKRVPCHADVLLEIANEGEKR